MVGLGQEVCVQIKADENVIAGNDLILTVDIKTSLTAQPLKFTWESSNRVKQITEKPTLTISTTKDDDGKEIEINLIVEGLPQNCLKNYQSFVPIIPPRLGIHDPDWFSNNLSWNEEKLWLSNISTEFKKKEESTLYLIIQTKNPKSKKNRKRQERIKNFLINTQKLNKERVKIILTKSGTEETQYWIVPKGAEPPTN